MKYLILLFACILISFDIPKAQASLRLLVNYSYTDTIAPGDPVILELQVYNPDAEYAAVHNNAVRQNLEILQQEFSQGNWTQEEYESEKSILENSIKAENPVSVAGDVLSGAQILFDGVPLSEKEYLHCTEYPNDHDQDFVLTSQTRLRVLFGISPEQTTRWTRGRHTLLMKLDSLETDTAALIVRPAYMESELMRDKRINLGYFYLDCGDPAQSLVIADLLLKTTPEFLDAVTLKADFYMTAGDTLQALEWYENALRLFYRQYPASYELPEYLLSQIAALKPQE